MSWRIDCPSSDMLQGSQVLRGEVGDSQAGGKSTTQEKESSKRLLLVLYLFS